jgi:hypothetical protein
MIKKKTEERGPIKIDLTGPEGNVFVLLGYAKRFAQQLEIDPKEVQDKMTSGDYENAVNVFDEYFGDYVILYR